MKKFIAAAVAVILLVAFGGSAGAAYYYGQDNTLPQGFNVGGLQLGGRSPDEALAIIRDRISAVEDTKVSVKLPDGPESPALPVRTLKQLGLQVSAEEAVQALRAYRDRGWWDRAKRLIYEDDGSSFGIRTSWDEAVLSREVDLAWGAAAGTEPRDAKREINSLDEVIYTEEIPGVQVDSAMLAEEVKKLAPSSLENLPAEQPAAVSIPVPVTEKMPVVTVASLKGEGIDRKIAEFTTSFTTSAAGRSHNVTVAAKALNDTLLMPDEVFEYGKIVAKADEEYGYQPAPVIVKGKLTPGVGGGICQVSSTLYNAVLKAGLDVVERRNHSLVVHYLPPGLDAAYADGYLNFRFRNSTGKQLLIRTEVKDKHLTVKLFGTLDENVDYKMVTEQIKVVAPKTVYVTNANLEPGKQKRLQRGENGLVVDTYRIKLINGAEAAREKMTRSTYKAQDELIAVHPSDPRLKPQDASPSPSGQAGPVEPV